MLFDAACNLSLFVLGCYLVSSTTTPTPTPTPTATTATTTTSFILVCYLLFAQAPLAHCCWAGRSWLSLLCVHFFFWCLLLLIVDCCLLLFIVAYCWLSLFIVPFFLVYCCLLLIVVYCLLLLILVFCCLLLLIIDCCRFLFSWSFTVFVHCCSTGWVHCFSFSFIGYTIVVHVLSSCFVGDLLLFLVVQLLLSFLSIVIAIVV